MVTAVAVFLFMDIKLINDDCIKAMGEIPPKSIDLVLTDPPYQITANKWDTVIPFGEMWESLERVAKGLMVFTASQPFSSMLVMSKPEWFRHEWIWEKNIGSNYLNCNREPMKEHEHILVFSPRGNWTFNRQLQERNGGGKERVKYDFNHISDSSNYRKVETPPQSKGKEMRVPSSVQKFNVERGLHPTQKPVTLMEYLIKTYSNPGETVLDFTMGSGTTGVAAVSLGRKFIGIEIDKEYFRTAEERLSQVQLKLC